MRCIEKVSERYVAIGRDRVRSKRCFCVRMTPKVGVGGVTQREHRRALKEFFLPMFERKRHCLLFGVAPTAIASGAPNLDVTQSGDHWVISGSRSFNGPFPYWTGDVSTFDKHQLVCRLSLLLQVDPSEDGAELDALLRRSWDPIVFSNPQSAVTEGVLTFAKKTTARGPKLWLAYRLNPIEMRIGFIGSGNVLATAYERTLRQSQATQYFGNEFYNEERGVQWPRRPSAS